MSIDWNSVTTEMIQVGGPIAIIVIGMIVGNVYLMRFMITANQKSSKEDPKSKEGVRPSDLKDIQRQSSEDFKFFLETIKEYPKQLQEIGHDCHANNKEQNETFMVELKSQRITFITELKDIKNYYDSRLEEYRQDNRVMMKEVIAAITESKRATKKETDTLEKLAKKFDDFVVMADGKKNS